MVEIRGLRGFRDFYPEEFAIRSHITRAWRDVARRYGFEEFDGPPLEPLEIYTQKSGAEIVDQLYEFEDKGGRHVALRPEMTPTLARMVGARARALRKPIRWFSIPQLFRYERQQRGRLREHFQLNVDILGENDVLADAELLAVAIDVMRALGLDASQVRARVSDRRLLGALFTHLGVPEDQVLSVYQIVDKLDRVPRESLTERLRELGLADSLIEGIFAAMTLAGLDALTREYGGINSLGPRIAELTAYVDHLENLGVREFVDVDLSIVRGLAYYTGIVFELRDARGELRAICGGGRYDDLLRVLTGIEMPALGFGMGDVVLAELLGDNDLLPEYRRDIDCYMVTIGEAARSEALRITQLLRRAGFSAVFDYRARSPRAQFKNADQLGARWAIVIGPDELAAGEARVRVLESGEESSVSVEDLIANLKH